MVEHPRPKTEPRVAFAGVTDVGRQRKHNEDCLLIKAELGLFCVADGMGGHNAGDVASKLVTTSLGNYFEATVPGQGDPRATGIEHELSEDYAMLSPGGRRLAAGVSKANRDVYTISNTHQQHHGMGSTCVALHLAEGMVHIAHVGDSRCYRIRKGEIVQMTRDHSLINDALDMKPDLTKEELSRLPKNIITRALGMKDLVKVDVKSEPTLPGDMYLLCSDGLTGMVPVDQILDVINLTPEPQEACELLVAEANDHGGTDNISALLVRIEDELAEAADAGEVAGAPGEIDISGQVEPYADDDDEDGAPTFEINVPPSLVAAHLAALAENPHLPPPPPVPAAMPRVVPQPIPQAETPRPVALRESKPAPHAVAHEDTAPPRPTSPPIPAPRPSAPVLARGGLALPPPPPPVPQFPPQPVAKAPAPAPAPSAPVAPAAPVSRPPVLELVPHADVEVVSTPHVEVGDDGDDLEDLTDEEAAALASGGEIDLDLRGPWPAKAVIKRCALCRYELFPGNRFCTECGARVEAAAPASDGRP